MIRKVIIVVFILISVGSGTIGMITGSGLFNWSYKWESYKWEKSEWRSPDHKVLEIDLSGTKRSLKIIYTVHPDKRPYPKDKKVLWPGLVYRFAVRQGHHRG